MTSEGINEEQELADGVAAQLLDLDESIRAAAELVERGRAAYDSDLIHRLAAEAISNRLGEAVANVVASATSERADMKDVRILPGPGVPHGLIIPDAELVERFSRSPGPGGQSVNTTDSRVELSWDPSASEALDESQRARVIARSAGPIVVVSHEQRSQHRNRVAARERLALRIRELLAPPPPTRRPTKPTRGSKERRLDAKRQRSQTKQLRGRVQD